MSESFFEGLDISPYMAKSKDGLMDDLALQFVDDTSMTPEELQVIFNNPESIIPVDAPAEKRPDFEVSEIMVRMVIKHCREIFTTLGITDEAEINAAATVVGRVLNILIGIDTYFVFNEVAEKVLPRWVALKGEA